MNHWSVNCRSRPRAWVVALSLAMAMGGAAMAGATEQAVSQTAASVPAAPASMPEGGMAHMAGHMYMTTLRPAKDGDRQKADALVQSAKAAMAARSSFDPSKPTSLLYTKTADGGYKLVGAMYTDRVDASEDELNGRIPLSIARWHQHINFCKAPEGRKREYFGPDAKFGLLGSITTKEACEAAGGEFHAHIFGWMVHVYPYETEPKKIWSTDDDEQGHDNMDHAAMPGMNMPQK